MVGDELLRDNPLWIADVGASNGTDPRWGNFTSHYQGILFEPDPRAYEALQKDNKQNLTVLNTALGDSARIVDFHLCKKQEVSSVYLPNMEYLAKFPDSHRFEVTRDVSIETDTLDNQLQEKQIAEIDFIKIDTQGYELSILQGGTSYLKNAVGMELEVEFAQMYENQPLFADVDHFARDLGFELIDLKRYFWKRKDSVNTGDQKGQLVFGDALYFRSPEQILLIDSITAEKIVRSICVYLVYGYVDLAQSLSKQALDKQLLPQEIGKKVDYVLSKFEQKHLLAFAKKKKYLPRLFENLGNYFFPPNSWYSGTDKSLGNRKSA